MGNRLIVVAALVGLAWWMSKQEVEGAPIIRPPAGSGSADASFTASSSQLDQLVAAGYSKGSPEYEEAVDLSYAQVAATLLPGQMVGWTSEKGYYAVTIGSPEYYAAM